MSDGAPLRSPRVRAVLFDLDGTLLDTFGLIRASFRHATREVLGAELSDEVLIREMGVPLEKLFGRVAPGNEKELVRVYREHNLVNHDSFAKAFPGTNETLSYFHARQVPMGVVTSKGSMLALRGLRLFELREYFGVVVTADDVAIHKPDPYPLRLAAQVLGIALAHCAYVGDSPLDMKAARRGGALAVGALWGAVSPEALTAAGPDVVIDQVARLPRALEYE